MTNHHQESLTTYPKPGPTREQEQVDEEMMSMQMQALRITNSLAFPMVFKAALELGVLHTIVALEEGVWLSPSEIAFGLPTKPTNPEAPMLIDPEPVCAFFVNRGVNSGSLMSQFMLLQSQVFFKTWTHLKDVIHEEKDAFSSAHGMGLYEYVETDEQFAAIFNQAMSDSSTMIMTKILEVYKGLKDVNTLVDIGGGLGTILNLVISSKYPQIKGVEHVPGDMFIDVPKGDAIFMRRILRDWNDKDCVKILTNCWKSLPEKGKVIIVDMVAPSEPKSDDIFSKVVWYGHVDVNTMFGW
ncbi:O-methyltransferase domain [Arabidopsis thaliana x Arabidopsis arenosa]|nr:O-methyltransferase domain [Arabidopsis thaliana x Arabidopsis arenosa]